MSIENAERINPFDAEDQRIADRLGIILPELWMSDRYEQRLELVDMSLQVDPDNLVRAFDRLGIQSPRQFGIVFDSLDHDAGAETDQIYQIPDTYRRTLDTMPVFRLLADPTPTDEEHSAQLTDFGLLIGSRVMADLTETERSAELAEEKKKHASHLTVGGVAAQFTTAIGNIAANSAHLYDVLPYIGSGAGLVVVGGGLTARIVTAIKSRHMKEQDLCEYAEDQAEEAVAAVAAGSQIISFVPTFGGSEATRKMLKDIQAELDAVDPSSGQF